MDAGPLIATVRSLGGVARTPTLIARGHSRHALATALAAGTIERVRRGWVTLPAADPHLVAAARAGVVLTCLTQASRLGLWTLADGRVHVAAPSHAARVTTDATVHWHRPVVPRHPDHLVDPIENVLSAVSRCTTFENALAVWESALRKGLTSRPALERLPLTPTARRLCREMQPFADSGLETPLPYRLRWLNLPMLPQAWILGRPADLLIGDRLVVQVDGGHHVGAQRAADIEHDARLMLHGYHVIRVTYWQVVDEWPRVQDLIARAVAQGLHHAH